MVPKVMIILGSASDKEIAMKAIKILEKLQISYSIKVASAHRTHDKVKKLVIDATNQGRINGVSERHYSKTNRKIKGYGIMKVKR